MNWVKLILKYIFLFIIGGFTYYMIEILWRGYSHWSMFILGGICFLFAGIQNEYIEWEYPLWRQILNVDIFVLISEFITGCIVNLYFHCLFYNLKNKNINYQYLN